MHVNIDASFKERGKRLISLIVRPISERCVALTIKMVFFINKHDS
jgi:hypothetical protein